MFYGTGMVLFNVAFAGVIYGCSIWEIKNVRVHPTYDKAIFVGIIVVFSVAPFCCCGWQYLKWWRKKKNQVRDLKISKMMEEERDVPIDDSPR